MNQQNPYASPAVNDSSTDGVFVDRPPRRWSVLIGSYLCVLVSMVAILGFGFSALMLIPQAERLELESLNYPPQFRNQDDKVIRSSRVLGYAAVLLCCVTLYGGILALNQRWLAGWALLLVSVGVYVTLAILMNPT